MKGKRFPEEKIIGVLKESEAGADTKELCRRHGITVTTFYRWKAKFGGMDVSDARKLRALEDRNRKLKRDGCYWVFETVRLSPATAM